MGVGKLKLNEMREGDQDLLSVHGSCSPRSSPQGLLPVFPRRPHDRGRLGANDPGDRPQEGSRRARVRPGCGLGPREPRAVRVRRWIRPTSDSVSDRIRRKIGRTSSPTIRSSKTRPAWSSGAEDRDDIAMQFLASTPNAQAGEAVRKSIDHLLEGRNSLEDTSDPEGQVLQRLGDLQLRMFKTLVDNARIATAKHEVVVRCAGLGTAHRLRPDREGSRVEGHAG